MKMNLTRVAVVASILALSGTAFAGGESCASKKGAHKDMSAAVTKDAQDHHGIATSQDVVEADKSAAVVNEVTKDAPVQSPSGALKI
jgi:hypothetical protein